MREGLSKALTVGTEDLRNGKSKESIVVLASDGVSIRNFILSSVLRKLSDKMSTALWHSLPRFLDEHIDKKSLVSTRSDAFKDARENLLSRVLRRSKLFAQLFWLRELGSGYFLTNLKKNSGLKSKTISFVSVALGKAFANDSRLPILERSHRMSVSLGGLESEKKALVSTDCSVVLATHQRSSVVIPTMVAAQTLGIPTVNFIYSWDNLPKGRMAVPADYFFVWSEHMKDEMARYYPEVPPENIFVTGTPQFEHYFNDELVWSENEFRSRLGLERNKKVVVFSGDDVTTSPLDPFYLADVAEAIRHIPGPLRPHLIFRRCPVDVSGRYGWVIEKYPEIIVSDPLWRKSDETDSWDAIVPTKEDVELLCNLVRHSDLVINIGSTMALDFAIFDKPAIFIRYDQQEDVGDVRRDIEEIYSLPHFQVFDGNDSVVWARSKESLPSLIVQSLEHPEQVAKDRKRLLEKIAAHPLEQASDRIISALIEISDRHSSGRIKK